VPKDLEHKEHVEELKVKALPGNIQVCSRMDLEEAEDIDNRENQEVYEKDGDNLQELVSVDHVVDGRV
jgi:hypothetical protein